MALLWQNKGNGRLYYRVWRATGCSTHVINTSGEDYLRQHGLKAGDQVPDELLQELESYAERLSVETTSKPTSGKRRRRRLIAPQHSSSLVMALVKMKVRFAIAFGKTGN